MYYWFLTIESYALNKLSSYFTFILHEIISIVNNIDISQSASQEHYDCGINLSAKPVL